MQKMDKYKARYKMKADIRWLDDPEIYQVNRMDAHSDHAYYENYEEEFIVLVYACLFC